MTTAIQSFSSDPFTTISNKYYFKDLREIIRIVEYMFLPHSDISSWFNTCVTVQGQMWVSVNS